jgi:hypothetical protein
LIEKSVKNIAGVKVASVMSCTGRGRVAVSLKLPELEGFIAGGRQFEAFLNFGNGHDQSCQLFTNTSNICTVCNNTFAANLLHEGKAVNLHVKHTRNSKALIDNMPDLIQASIEVQKQFAASFNALSEKTISHSAFKAVLIGALVDDFTDEQLADSAFILPMVENRKGEQVRWTIAGRTENRIDTIVNLFHDDKKGNAGATLADGFSAITDYFSHESAGDDKWKQFVSSEWPTGAACKAKNQFWAFFNNPERFAAAQAKGERILSLLKG